MDEEGFKNWLMNGRRHVTPKVASDYLARCKRVQAIKGNLDTQNLDEILNWLDNGAPEIHINGDRQPVINDLKAAIRAYAEFRG